MGISVVFGTKTLPNVKSIQKGSTLPPELINDVSGAKSVKQIQIIVQGMIFTPDRGYGSRAAASAIGTYETLESDLRNQATASLMIGSSITISSVRLVEIEFQEYRGNPVLFYSATFATPITNPFSESVTLQDGSGTTTFNPRPAVEDSYERQDPVISWVTQGATAGKSIKLSGILQGTISEVSNAEDDIVSRCTTSATMTLVIPSGTYTVKCVSFSFGTPIETETTASKTYSIEFITEKNYSIESENLPDTPLSIGGIMFTKVTSWSSNISWVNNNGTFSIESEGLNVSGEIHFTTFVAAEAYQANFKTSLQNPQTFASPTGKTLAVVSVNFSAPAREGRDTSGNQKYILTGSLSFEWLPSVTETCVTAGENIFGISWDCINSKSFSGTVNVCGMKTQDTISIDGIVSGVPSISVGEKYSYNGYDFYVTGVSFNGKNNQGKTKLSVSARTLDTFEKANTFLSVTLPSSGLVLNELGSYSKSVRYKYASRAYKSTSVSISISGNVYVGSGNADAFLALINELSAISGLSLNQFRITSVSVGAKEKFIDETNCTIGYKQSVSASYEINFEADGNSAGKTGNTDVSVVEDESVEIEQIKNKYSQIAIPGGNLYFKKVGLIPGKVKITRTRRRIGGDATLALEYPTYPSAPVGPEEMFLSDSKLSASGSTRKAEVEYTILKGTVSAIQPNNGTVVGTLNE